MKAFTPWTLAARGLIGWWPAHASVAAGVAVATAVLVGALVVGDSVRGSLRDLTLERLGQIDHVVAPGRPFRIALADEVAAATPGARTAPVLLGDCGATSGRGDETRQASGLALVGCDDRFAALAGEGEPFPAPRRGVALTEAVARELHVGEGDFIVLRTSRAGALPGDSALGEKDEVVASRRLPVERVLPPRGLARFGLMASQADPRTVFVALGVAQELANLAGRCNAAVITGARHPEVAPTLEDYGLTLDEARLGVFQLESSALVLPPEVEAAARAAWRDESVAGATTYLANTLRRGERSVPYSTVTGVEAVPGVEGGPPLASDRVVLNRWAADDLEARPGDEVVLTYYEPESTHGALREAPPLKLVVEAIIDLEDSSGAPTAAADRRYTPRLEGVTDAKSINNWDLPFELIEPIRDRDEEYWERHATTPKAFISLELARRLWGTRWGETSLLRVAAPGERRQELERALVKELRRRGLGFAPRPLRAEALAASSGSTPFDVLFLMFSLFLIAASLMLVGLLVALAADARRRETGLLGALGFDVARLRRAWLRELGPVALIGAVAGSVAGVGYAALLVTLLRTVWLPAIGAPFVTLHPKPLTLALATAASWGVAVLTLTVSIRRATQTPPRALLAGATPDDSPLSPTTGRLATGASLAAATLAGVSLMAGGARSGESAAAAFFAGGGLLLVALLAAFRRLLAPESGRSLSLGRLALANVSRRATRSMLVVGLTASACFLVLATSAFRLPPTASGTGGYAIVAHSDLPLLHDPTTPAGRAALGVSLEDEETLASAAIASFRVQPGEDASCGNLYQATRPRVLGVSQEFIAAAGRRTTPFAWAATRAPEAPWQALERAPEGPETPLPVVLDYNTAVYSLKLYGGLGSKLTVRDEAGRGHAAEVVGLLKNSVLQGDLLMSEANFLRLYPGAAGSRFFLIDAEEPPDVARRLESSLRDYGFDATPAAVRLAGFLAVQNTYLATFQTLGALGLLLGSVGLAVAQLRNLLERRRELDLLRSAGFSAARLRLLVALENLLLLGAGLGIGAIAAAAALAPLAMASDAHVPWLAALALVGATAIVGRFAAWLATAGVLRGALTQTLRAD